jgi:microcystin degradation protein MlrC
MRVAIAEAMRVAIAELKQETNSFVPFLTTLDTFRDQYICAGEEVRTRFAAVRVEMAAFMDVLREAGVEAVPLTAAFAMASGPVARDAFEALMAELLTRLRAAGPLDGVLLALHGAMVLEDEPDAEAEIIARVRAVVGPGLPIAVSLDLHGHITQAMLQPDVAMIGYREYPHIDMYETGERTARLLLDWIAGRCVR